MDFENEVAGISATIDENDVAGALSTDEQIETTICVEEDRRSCEQDFAALEHLYVSIESLISTQESGADVNKQQAYLIAQPTTISVESVMNNVVDTIKKFIETCIRIGSDIIARIVRWAQNTKALLPSVLNSIKKLREQVENLPATLKSPTHTNPGGLARLAINNRIPRDAGEIFNGLKDVLSASSALYADYAAEVLSIEQRINLVLLTDLGNKSGEEFLTAVNKQVNGHRLFTRKLFKFSKQDGDMLVGSTPVLLGSRRLVSSWVSVPSLLKLEKETSPENYPFELAKAIQQTSVRMETTVTDDVALVPKAELFKTMDQKQMILMLDTAAAMLGIYDDFTANIQPDLKAQVENSQKKLMRMEMEKGMPVKLDGSISMHDARYFKAIISYHTALAKWASEPFHQFATYLLDIINACLRLIRVSVSQYE